MSTIRVCNEHGDFDEIEYPSNLTTYGQILEYLGASESGGYVYKNGKLLSTAEQGQPPVMLTDTIVGGNHYWVVYA